MVRFFHPVLKKENTCDPPGIAKLPSSTFPECHVPHATDALSSDCLDARTSVVRVEPSDTKYIHLIFYLPRSIAPPQKVSSARPPLLSSAFPA
jgi:hypothetical protein